MKRVIYTNDVQQTNVRESMPFPKKIRVEGEENFGHNQYILIKCLDWTSYILLTD